MGTYWFRIHFDSGKYRDVCAKADYPQQAIRWIQECAAGYTVEPLFTLLFVASFCGYYKA